jgi:hypothetical protein
MRLSVVSDANTPPLLPLSTLALMHIIVEQVNVTRVPSAHLLELAVRNVISEPRPYSADLVAAP